MARGHGHGARRWDAAPLRGVGWPRKERKTKVHTRAPEQGTDRGNALGALGARGRSARRRQSAARLDGKGRNGTACRHTAAARVGRIQSPLLGRPARRARAPQGTGSHGNVDQSGLGGPRTRDGLTAVTHLVPRQCDAFCVGAGRGKRQCRVPVKSSAGASGVVERAPQGESCTAAITVAASGRR